MSERYGLIFDVDGVIADTESVNRRVSVQVFDDLFGLKGVKAADFTAGLGRGAHEYIKAAARVHDLTLNIRVRLNVLASITPHDPPDAPASGDAAFEATRDDGSAHVQSDEPTDVAAT